MTAPLQRDGALVRWPSGAAVAATPFPTERSTTASEFGFSVGAAAHAPSVLSENTQLRRYVITDARAVLRWALPIAHDSPLRQIQRALEEAGVAFRSSRSNAVKAALKQVNRAVDIMQRERLNILADVPRHRRETGGIETLRRIEVDLGQLNEELFRLRDNASSWSSSSSSSTTTTTTAAIRGGKFIGSGVDAASQARIERIREQVLDDVGALEEVSVRKFPYRIPRRFDSLPRLLGRATVEMTLEKGKSGPADERNLERGAFVDSDTRASLGRRHIVRVVLDGYSAPLTAGNFADLVQRRAYDGARVVGVERNLYVYIDTGDDRGDSHRSRSQPQRVVPLEIRVDGEDAPFWGESLDLAGAGDKQPVLPIAPYGTLAMAHSPEELNDASRAFFFFLLDPRSGAVSNNVFTGSMAAFGYVTGDDAMHACLAQLAAGDKIVSARLVHGADKLFATAEAAAQSAATKPSL